VLRITSQAQEPHPARQYDPGNRRRSPHVVRECLFLSAPASKRKGFLSFRRSAGAGSTHLVGEARNPLA
jgi:hypothetical protein